MTDKEIVQALRCCKFGVPCEKCPVVGNKDCFDEVNTAAAELIERLTAENAALREKGPRWISVEERRPEPGKRVLATDDVFVGEAYRTSADTWRRYDGIAMRDCLGSIVTHWMPLPSAPKFADILRGAPEAPEEGDKHE
nr:MAG: Protein of unknown function (DUF551) [Bacteriophage sp.]